MTSNPGRRWVRTGDVVRIPQAHYCYGHGALTMRVSMVGADIHHYPALEWVRLCGVELRPDGSDGNSRDVLVRVAALRRQPLPEDLPRRRPVPNRVEPSA